MQWRRVLGLDGRRPPRNQTQPAAGRGGSATSPLIRSFRQRIVGRGLTATQSLDQSVLLRVRQLRTDGAAQMWPTDSEHTINIIGDWYGYDN
jgi:hypothetical protein